MAVALAACSEPEASDLDAPPCSGSRQEDRSLFNPVMQLGILGRLGSERSTVMLGASARSAPNLGLRRVLSSNPSVDLPWTLRAGLRFVHRKDSRAVADIELDGVAQLFMPPTVYAPEQPQDSVGLRLGGSYGLAVKSVHLVARAGFMFDWELHSPQQPAPQIAGFGQTQTVKLPEKDIYRLSGTVGLGVEARRFAVQLGYGYVSEQIRSASPFIGSASQASHLLSLSALLRFG